MSHPRRTTVLAAVALTAGLLAVGCSDDDGGDEPALPDVTPPSVVSSSGDRCEDATGDLDVPPGAVVGPELAGIDLVEGVAEVEGELLRVRFTTAGPVEAVADPVFVVAQGEPLDSLAFELRLERADAGWSSTLVTWPSGRSGGEERRGVPQPVVVDDDTVALDVPLSALPPIALTMQFGSAAEVAGGAVVIDDCSTLTQPQP